MVTHSRGRPPLPAAHEVCGVLAGGPSTSPSLSRFQPCLWSGLGRRGSGTWAARSSQRPAPCLPPADRLCGVSWQVSRWAQKPFEKSTWEGGSLWGPRRPRLPSGRQPTSGDGVPQVLGASLLLSWWLVRGCSLRTGWNVSGPHVLTRVLTKELGFPRLGLGLGLMSSVYHECTGGPSHPTPRLPTRCCVVLVDVPGRRPFHLFYSLGSVHVPGA